MVPMHRERRKQEAAAVIGRIATGFIALALPQSGEILSPEVILLLCACAFAFSQGELEQRAEGGGQISWWTVGCFTLGVLVNIGSGRGDVLGGILGWICMAVLYVLGRKVIQIRR